MLLVLGGFYFQTLLPFLTCWVSATTQTELLLKNEGFNEPREDSLLLLRWFSFLRIVVLYITALPL